MDTKDKKITKNREKKEQVVARIVDKTKNAKSLIFTNYQGMTHKQIEDLKKALKAVGGDMIVTKNTLLKIALKGTDFKDVIDNQDFNHPTATILASKDPIAPLKELAKAIKNLKLPVIKFGVFEGRVLNESEVIKLSTLPPREVLIAQLVGTMKSPIYGLHRALSWNMQKFVMTLKAIETKKV